MTVMGVLGEIRELPAAVENAPELARFEDFLVERGEMPRTEARTLVSTLVASVLEGVGTRAGRAMRVHLNAIVEIRATLRFRYGEVIEIFSGRRGPVTELPPHLEEPAFNDLFDQLADHLNALRDPVGGSVDLMDDPGLRADLSEVEPRRQRGEPVAELPDVLTDPTPDPRQWRPGTYEQQRVELDWYREALRDNPDPQLRAAAEASLRAFMNRWQIPGGWRLRLRRIPEYGYTLEQMEALASRDPDFAGRGFEVVIDVPAGAAPWVGPRGASFAPDGVMQGPRGFLFLEHKASWAPEPAGFYASPEGRAALRADMTARARMSTEIPGCGGWGYHTGTPWLDEALSSVLESLRDEDPELAGRIHMLSDE
jgi:hypothetical protein